MDVALFKMFAMTPILATRAYEHFGLSDIGKNPWTKFQLHGYSNFTETHNNINVIMVVMATKLDILKELCYEINESTLAGACIPTFSFNSSVPEKLSINVDNGLSNAQASMEMIC